MNLLQRIVSAGTAHAAENEQRSTRIVNILCLTTASMSLLFSIFSYALTGSIQVALPAFTEGLVFVALIILNSQGWNKIAGLGMILVNNLAILYYSAILGKVTEVHLLFLFLMGTSLLVFKDLLMRALCLGITITALVICEVNFYYEYITPVLAGEEQRHTEFVIRWVTVPSILLLDILVIYFYVKHIDALLKKVTSYSKVLEQRTAELERATLAKTVFVRETSHEIRTPLNAVFGISQLLQLKVENDASLAPVRSLVHHLYAASYNTREIVNNVLEFSRIEAGQPDTPQAAPLEVRSWVQNIISMHQYVASVKGVNIRCRVADDVPAFITGDRVLLAKALNNLLSNAIKFTAQGSAVTVHIFCRQERWCVQVSDQGAGISKERLATIFDPFVTERNLFLEGTGLGLHITRHLATLLGGRIDVHSIPGTGTTFTLDLPLVPAPAESDAEPESQPLNNLHATCILIIEDDQMSQLVLSRFLSGLGSRVLLAGNGEEGIRLAKAERPDVIILDSHMPGISGRETLLHIRSDEALKNVPVIISSGNAFKEDSEAMLRAGANEYVVKPIEFKMLYATLSKYVAATG